MNLELLDPWEQEYPQSIEDIFEDGYVLTCRFNGRGTLIAAGCLDGRCIVWDLETKEIMRVLFGHVKPVECISWSRDGRYLLSASRDWNCVLWDLMTGTPRGKARLTAPVIMAHIHPKNSFLFVAAVLQARAVLVDVTSSSQVQVTELCLEKVHDENTAKSCYISAVAWNKTGSRLYAGSSKGHLHVIDANTREVVYTTRVTNMGIKEIVFGQNGKDILVNGHDRIIRYYTLKHHDDLPEHRNKFQDLVNRIQWNTVCFSADGEFVIGGSANKAAHNIYIWDKNIGNLVKILEGPKEQLDDVTWHPTRPVIASVSSYGNIYIWANKHVENWSAFAPDFTELEENFEYEEREDEFDVVPEEEKTKRKQDDEDTMVDITTLEDPQVFVDPDETTVRDEIFFLPYLDQPEGRFLSTHRQRNNIWE